MSTPTKADLLKAVAILAQASIITAKQEEELQDKIEREVYAT